MKPHVAIPLLALLAAPVVGLERTTNFATTNTLVFFAATNEAVHPSTWTSNGVGVYHGHTPFARNAQIPRTIIPTNAAATQQTIRLNPRAP